MKEYLFTNELMIEDFSQDCFVKSMRTGCNSFDINNVEDIKEKPDLIDFTRLNQYFKNTNTGDKSLLWNMALMLGRRDKDYIEQQAKMYKIVDQRIIHDFLQIPGFEEMYDSNFLYLEWALFLAFNDRKGEKEYYRDHFIHQAKVGYMGHKLIEELELVNDISKIVFYILKNNDDRKVFYNFYSIMELSIISIISKTGKCGELKDKIFKKFGECFEMLLNEYSDAHTVYDPWFFDIVASEVKSWVDKEHSKKIFAGIIEANASQIIKEFEEYELCNNKMELCIREIFDTVKRFIRMFILKTYYITALFHDIAYPMKFFHKYKDSISSYLPQLSHFLNINSDNFNSISSTLTDTLLFHKVPKEEIKVHFDNDVHGAMSALVFLMYFYNSGAIATLNSMDKNAINIAATAIYDHTIDYSSSDKMLKGNTHINYYDNPISYILRYCDDIQEWDRNYFDIVEVSNLSSCGVCGTPSLLVNEENRSKYSLITDNDKKSNDLITKEFIKQSSKIRACACSDYKYKYEELLYGKQNKFLSSFYNVVSTRGHSLHPDGVFWTANEFNYQKVFMIRACEGVKYSISDDKGIKNIDIKIEYDKFRLLEILISNPRFTQFRAKELYSFKEVFKEGYGFAKTNANAFLSANPIVIKVAILKDYLKKSKTISEMNIDSLINYDSNQKCFTINKEQFNLCFNIFKEFKFYFNKISGCEKCLTYNFLRENIDDTGDGRIINKLMEDDSIHIELKKHILYQCCYNKMNLLEWYNDIVEQIVRKLDKQGSSNILYKGLNIRCIVDDNKINGTKELEIIQHIKKIIGNLNYKDEIFKVKSICYKKITEDVTEKRLEKFYSYFLMYWYFCQHTKEKQRFNNTNNINIKTILFNTRNHIIDEILESYSKIPRYIKVIIYEALIEIEKITELTVINGIELFKKNERIDIENSLYSSIVKYVNKTPYREFTNFIDTSNNDSTNKVSMGNPKAVESYVDFYHDLIFFQQINQYNRNRTND